MKLIKMLCSMFNQHKTDSHMIEELEEIFQQGNIVRSDTGEEFVVRSTNDLSMAFVTSRQTGGLHIVDWLTPAGTLARKVLQRWTLVATPAQIAAEFEEMFEKA